MLDRAFVRHVCKPVTSTSPTWKLDHRHPFLQADGLILLQNKRFPHEVDTYGEKSQESALNNDGGHDWWGEIAVGLPKPATGGYRLTPRPFVG